MQKLLQRILFFYNRGNHKFDSDLWISYPDKRKVFLKDLFKNKLAIGKTQEQILRLLGDQPRIYSDGKWSYPIEDESRGKSKQALHLYFDNGVVTDAKVKIKIKE